MNNKYDLWVEWLVKHSPQIIIIWGIVTVVGSASFLMFIGYAAIHFLMKAW